MRLTRILAITSLLVAASLSMAQGLNIGDKAPDLNVTTWVKGTPQKLGDGKITVVEFWATWCGPCKMSIPHLTELAHKYKDKVSFVGVSIWESKPEDYTKAVPDFVKEYGDKMDYNVATEGPAGFMAKNWMAASGQDGIPSAFLIDGEGKVAWIGHPMAGLDTAIDKLLAGTLDTEKARKERASAMAGKMKELKVQELLNKKKFQEASDEVDKIVKAEPELKPQMSMYKLVSMVQGNLKGLDTYITALGKEDFASEPSALNNILWTVVEHDLKLAPAAYKASVKVGEKMMAKAPSDPMNMDTYALVLWRAGEKKKALETQKKAVALAIADKQIPAETVKEMQERLKEFGG